MTSSVASSIKCVRVSPPNNNMGYLLQNKKQMHPMNYDLKKYLNTLVTVSFPEKWSTLPQVWTLYTFGTKINFFITKLWSFSAVLFSFVNAFQQKPFRPWKCVFVFIRFNILILCFWPVLKSKHGEDVKFKSMSLLSRFCGHKLTHKGVMY